jgi:hypothetical protein
LWKQLAPELVPEKQISDLFKTPLIQAGVVSPGAQGSAALPQATEVEEAKQAAGDPIGDEAVIARAEGDGRHKNEHVMPTSLGRGGPPCGR